MKRPFLLALAAALFAATVAWRNVVTNAGAPGPWWLGLPGLGLAILGCAVLVRACGKNLHRVESGEVIEHRSTPATTLNLLGLPRTSSPTSLSSHLPATYELRLRDDHGRTGWLRFDDETVLDNFPVASYYPG